MGYTDAASAGAKPSSSRPHEWAQRRRYEPTAAYLLAERLRDEGIMLDAIEGPWRAGGRTLGRQGRNNIGLLPIVTNGRTEVMVDTMEHAADVAGFLNWCGVEGLNPIPDLTPPSPETLGSH